MWGGTKQTVGGGILDCHRILKDGNLNWRQKHPFFPNPVVYTNIVIPSLQRFLKCYVPLFVFSVTVPNGEQKVLLAKLSFHVYVTLFLKSGPIVVV